MDQDPDGYKRGKSPLHTKSYLFAVRIIKMYQYLVENKRCYDIAHQVVRSGTSIGASVREAEFAQSPQDFVHKLSISLKEANETDYWLTYCRILDSLMVRCLKACLLIVMS